ncbi:hypothetical protein [uncultured Pseudacidovorax sp.]|uniref:hypothetical protein n=1 Tax=uncultured Pseudacidovorax sp. TaxID=679313 RepID=UPI0025D7F0DD|nr:hypothetical protein [uncultured Pseudacidovorax sp.]
MQVKLKRSVLVGDADVFPTRGGTVVDLDHAKAKEFIAAGLAEAVEPSAPSPTPAPAPLPPAEVGDAPVSAPVAKVAEEGRNKMAPETSTKAAGKGSTK